jgi:hypothetical protein
MFVSRVDVVRDIPPPITVRSPVDSPWKNLLLARDSARRQPRIPLLSAAGSLRCAVDLARDSRATQRSSPASFFWISCTISIASRSLLARDIGAVSVAVAVSLTRARRRACRSRSAARACSRSRRRRLRADRLRCVRRQAGLPHSRCFARCRRKETRHTTQRSLIDITAVVARRLEPLWIHSPPPPLRAGQVALRIHSPPISGSGPDRLLCVLRPSPAGVRSGA